MPLPRPLLLTTITLVTPRSLWACKYEDGEMPQTFLALFPIPQLVALLVISAAVVVVRRRRVLASLLLLLIWAAIGGFVFVFSGSCGGLATPICTALIPWSLIEHFRAYKARQRNEVEVR